MYRGRGNNSAWRALSLCTASTQTDAWINSSVTYRPRPKALDLVLDHNFAVCLILFSIKTHVRRRYFRLNEDECELRLKNVRWTSKKLGVRDHVMLVTTFIYRQQQQQKLVVGPVRVADCLLADSTSATVWI